jgi:gluconate 2-dehydrogenase gamma chain
MNKFGSDNDMINHGECAPNRREFVKVLRDGAVVLLLPQALGCRTRPRASVRSSDSAYVLKFFTSDEAMMVEAISDRIFPSDETAGAREAKVVQFIDYMLSSGYASYQSMYRDGLRRLNEITRAQFGRSFVQLNATEQDAVLTRIDREQIPNWDQSGPFFSLIRAHTIEGIFSDPRYHGNVGGVGWKLVGLDHQHT